MLIVILMLLLIFLFLKILVLAAYPKVSGYPELSWYFILHTYFEKIIPNSTCFYDKNTVFFVSSTQWDVFYIFRFSM